MIDPDNLSNRELTAKVADLEKRLAAIEGWRAQHLGAGGHVEQGPDTRVSDAVRARDTLGRRDVMGSQHAAGR